MPLVQKLLLDIIRASEKASLIARACRREDDLFSLLIEEKKCSERTSPDFKTLADVLIQEMIKYELASANLSRDQIKGEENNEFTNTLGESITVKVQANEEETAKLLESVLDGHSNAAKSLARLVHTKSIEIHESVIKYIQDTVPENLEIDVKNMSLWVDPIDSTNNYIRGTEGSNSPISSIASNGLPVVTVLIGLHDIHTGKPVLGVINSPFVERNSQTNEWNGRVFWGLSLGETRLNNVKSTSSTTKPTIVCGNKESPKICQAVKSTYNIVRAQGAGYKSLVVALGLSDFYICSKDTTNKWDTCAGQGILASVGGGICNFYGNEEINNVLENENVEADKKWRNASGIIAYRDKSMLIKLREVIEKLSS